jgi:predicted DNA-binding protein
VPQPRLYEEPTVGFTVRLSRRHRGLIEYLATKIGQPPSTYVRGIIEDHIRAKGYDLHQTPPPQEPTP